MSNVKSQPAALPVLFLTEMWERFGFYVVQGLLILYMTEHLNYTDKRGYATLGAFTALAYISPFVGGYLADKILGFSRTIVWGGIALIIGYALLSIPKIGDTLFYPGLATIVIGTGLFKPCISSLLGTQYNRDDPRRDAGFTIFYIGINLGAFLAGASSGYIKNAYGWHVGFFLASIGLVIGLIVFSIGSHRLIKMSKDYIVPARIKLRIITGCLVAIAGMTFLLRASAITEWLLPTAGLFLAMYLIVVTMQQHKEDRTKLFLLNILILSSIVFWMIYLQMFFSANLYIDRLVDKDVFGIHIATTVFYASESIFIMLLGPVFAWLWHTLGHANKNPSTISKFILGIAFMGVAFFIMSQSARFPNEEGLINPAWVFVSYFFITIGELLLSPIGLSAVTILAPGHLVGMMMGVWFVATGFGGVFAGVIAKMASVPDSAAITVAHKLAIYHDAFLNYSEIAFFTAAVLYFVQFPLKKYITR